MEYGIKTDFNEMLDKAESYLKTADHLIYITYPLIKENVIIKTVLDNLHKTVINVVKSILNYEGLYKRIQLIHENADINTFQRCAPRFNITVQEISTIKEIFSLAEKRQESTMEFIRRDKLVIMSDNLKTESISLEQLKKYLNILKIILHKTKEKISQDRNILIKY